jgi:hypothetical protein
MHIIHKSKYQSWRKMELQLLIYQIVSDISFEVGWN